MFRQRPKPTLTTRRSGSDRERRTSPGCTALIAVPAGDSRRFLAGNRDPRWCATAGFRSLLNQSFPGLRHVIRIELVACNCPCCIVKLGENFIESRRPSLALPTRMLSAPETGREFVLVIWQVGVHSYSSSRELRWLARFDISPANRPNRLPSGRPRA